MQRQINRHLCKTLTTPTKNLTSQCLQSIDQEPLQQSTELGPYTVFSVCQNDSFLRIVLDMRIVTASAQTDKDVRSCFFLPRQASQGDPSFIFTALYHSYQFFCKSEITKSIPLSVGPNTSYLKTVDFQSTMVIPLIGNTMDLPFRSCQRL